jgi:quercetin dioxygenase-like cupin family protein
MAGLKVKNVKKPDETRPFADKGHLDLLKLGDLAVGCATFEPGWRWSQHVKPLAGTKTCEASHTGYCLAGSMRIRMDDGEEQDINPGDAFTIEPGHDAWVTGKDTCLMLDFSGFEDYAKPKAARAPAGAEQRPAMH